jgi:hypothetical protein
VVSFLIANLAQQKNAQHSVQRTGGSLRHFQAFFWLRAFSTSQAFSQPAHPPLTQTVGLLVIKSHIKYYHPK